MGFDRFSCTYTFAKPRQLAFQIHVTLIRTPQEKARRLLAKPSRFDKSRNPARVQGIPMAVKVAVAGGITGILALLVPHALLSSKDLQDFLTKDWVKTSVVITAINGFILSLSLIFGRAFHEKELESISLASIIISLIYGLIAFIRIINKREVSHIIPFLYINWCKRN